MLLYLVSRIVSAAGAFVYPTYASYKTLSRRPASEADLERWLMYWSVLGTLLALEYTAEWTISWIPFYYTAKTLFLLYLALPHTRGATYVYTAHLRPCLAAHEAEIDVALLRAREAGARWAQRRVRAAWAYLVNHTGVGGIIEGAEPEPEPASHPPPAYANGGPLSIAQGLWRTYAPILTTLLPPAPPSPPATHAPSSPPPVSPPDSPSTSTSASASAHTSALDDTRASLLARRRALEAELAALPHPPPSSSPPATMSRMASSTYLPAQGDERGRYEEIAADEAPDGTPSPSNSGEGRRASWWWGRADGYERVKTE